MHANLACYLDWDDTGRRPESHVMLCLCPPANTPGSLPAREVAARPAPSVSFRHGDYQSRSGSRVPTVQRPRRLGHSPLTGTDATATGPTRRSGGRGNPELDPSRAVPASSARLGAARRLNLSELRIASGAGWRRGEECQTSAGPRPPPGAVGCRAGR